MINPVTIWNVIKTAGKGIGAIVKGLSKIPHGVESAVLTATKSAKLARAAGTVTRVGGSVFISNAVSKVANKMPKFIGEPMTIATDIVLFNNIRKNGGKK